MIKGARVTNMFVIESAGLTDIGKRRKRNEDSLLVNDELGLYIVADGMGGHRAGDVASKLVVDTLRDYLNHLTDGNDDDVSEDIDTSLSREANRLLHGIQLTNRAVFDLASSTENYRGMGSTVSLLLFSEQTLIAANIGDSPIYLIHQGKIEQLSVPHTVKAEHAAIDPEGAEQLSDEFEHILTRAVGSDESVSASVCEIQYFKDDALVLCSDGLSDIIKPDEILETIGRLPSSEEVCRSLVNLANERGGHDNITVIVLKIRANQGKMRGFISRVTGVLSNITSRKKS